MFPSEHRSFIPETDPAKLKISDYKKLYGKKFSRYDKNYNTIDVTTLPDRKPTEVDFFSSKKHFKDESSINKSQSSSISKEYMPRKLTLPRLQGKYRVLDRY
jgi:hypothetical protein